MVSFNPIFLVVCIAAAVAQNCEVIDGVRQSPINIDTSTVTIIPANPLSWSLGYYLVPNSMEILNDGHSLKLTVNHSYPLELSSGILDVPYTFNQLHFHWGDNDDWGSEHQIDNHLYPLEMHMVHSQTATEDSDQFVVVTYFFRKTIRNNRGLQNILDVALQAAENRNERISVSPFALSELANTKYFSYYSYKGSLTTPPYTESVTWIIAANALPISESQLKILRNAASIEQGLKNNFRCLQDINGRKIDYVIPINFYNEP